MRNQELSRQIQRLRSLIVRADQASGGNLELQAHWARYLCVLSAGLLENGLVEVYSDFVVRTAPAPVASYATHCLGQIQNPKSRRFHETAEKFKGSWALALQTYLNEEGRREAVDSIMANRHLISHGDDSGITLARLKTYLDKAIEVLTFIETQAFS